MGVASLWSAVMADNQTIPWEWLESRRSTAFLAAAVLLFPFFVSNGLGAFTSAAVPRVVDGLFIASGLIASHLGLLGLVPQLAERVPRQARVGAVAVGIASVCAVGMLVADVLISVPAVAVPAIASGIFWLVMGLTTILGFVLLGTATLRTSVPSRTVGVALFGPPALYSTMFVTFFAAGMTPPEWQAVVLSGGQVLAHFAIGVTLRNGSVGTDSATPAGGPTVR